MAEQIPPQVQNQLMRFQELQEQLNNIVLRKRQFELESKEVDRALGESKSLPDDAVVYKSVGVLLFKSEKAKIVAELTDKKEETDLRIKTIEKQELRLKAQLEELRKTIMDQVNVAKGPIQGS
ncbi:MAG TPA: prefoldin subunit beta [Candidatus Methanomethylicus sp.]|jgi:prefoldin beta subunit|nr:prefoldin subunit beta [Candidatus Methanomethylicus sp.]HRR53853.1 prefoldin subunit beta [Candidatus Methanomethylicus sp.]HRU81244.1 prefoldin subunit beta [Candidatus Methanomethylicus sp.]